MILFQWQSEGRESSKQEQQKVNKTKVAPVNLTYNDEFFDIIRNGNWLTDIHMLAASKLLKEQFPEMNGLFDTKYGGDLPFPNASHPFVQNIHVGNSHWATVASCSPSSVCFYDSLYPTMSSHTKA